MAKRKPSILPIITSAEKPRGKSMKSLCLTTLGFAVATVILLLVGSCQRAQPDVPVPVEQPQPAPRAIVETDKVQSEEDGTEAHCPKEDRLLREWLQWFSEHIETCELCQREPTEELPEPWCADAKKRGEELRERVEAMPMPPLPPMIEISLPQPPAPQPPQTTTIPPPLDGENSGRNAAVEPVDNTTERSGCEGGSCLLLQQEE